MSTEKQDADAERDARVAAYKAADKANRQESITGWGVDRDALRPVVSGLGALFALLAIATVVAGVIVGAGFVLRWW